MEALDTPHHEGGMIPKGWIRSGDILDRSPGGGKVIGMYWRFTIPLFWKMWEYQPWTDQYIYGKAAVSIFITNEFVENLMDYPIQRFRVWQHVR